MTAYDGRTRLDDSPFDHSAAEGEKGLDTGSGQAAAAVDGRISIEDGRVTVIPPTGGGSWPSIKPDKNVLVKVNGVEVKDRYTLSPGDVVEVLPVDQEPVCDIEITVDEYKMRAFAAVRRKVGRKFRIRDLPETTFGVVTAEQVEIVNPPEPTVEMVMEKLKEAGIVYGIDAEAVETLVAERQSLPTLVAQGRPPVDPVDGSLKFYFTEIGERDIDPNATRVDLYDRISIPWVEPGTLLAEKIDPVPGQPGMDVYGKQIRPRNYRNPVLSVGEGVELTNEGRQAVAAREGRPVLDGKTIKVIPSFVLPKNADASTGHIRFSGDVVINGDVLDGIEIMAGGLVEIHGLVSHAKVMGQQGVIVRKGVIGGQIRAGGISAECRAVLSVVQVLTTQLEGLLRAFRQLYRDPRIQEAKIPEGQIIKQLLEGKFKEIPKQIAVLEDHAASSPNLFEDFSHLVPALRKKLVGLGPASIGSIRELQPLLKSLQDLALYLEAMQAADADIEVKSLQNAFLEASGKVIINGAGCYHSTITAGKGVKAPLGLLRGGQVTVHEGNVEFKELGGPGGVTTEVTIVAKGTIIAQKVYPNVTLSIAGEKRVVRDPIRHIRAFVNEEGQLVM